MVACQTSRKFRKASKCSGKMNKKRYHKHQDIHVYPQSHDM